MADQQNVFSRLQPLFHYFQEQHSLTLTQGEMNDIISIVAKLEGQSEDMMTQRDKALDERDNARIWVKSLQRERTEATGLIKELLLFTEASGEVINGFRVVDIINKMKSFIDAQESGSDD